MIDEDFSYRSTTAKAFLKEKNYDKLWEIWKHNINKTDEALTFLSQQDSHFHFFRVSSSLFPLATFNSELWSFFLSRADEIKSLCEGVGKRTKETSPNFRLVTHPGQFCVINSKRSDVIVNSIRELQHHVVFMEAFGLPWSINIHMSGKDSESADRMISTLNGDFSKYLKNHLSLENDEKSSNIQDVISVSQKTGCLVCYDVHHEAVNRTFKDQEYFLNLEGESSLLYIEKVWKDNLGLTPAFHLSNRLNVGEIKGKACAHSDYLYEESNKVIAPLLERGWALECEAKKKFPAVVDFVGRMGRW